MTSASVSSALAEEHIRDLHAAATRDRLLALARCCRPATWRRETARAASLVRRARASLRRGQLGPMDGYCGCA